MVGYDRGITTQVRNGTITDVETKICFTLFFVRPVTLEAMIRQDRSNIAIEVDRVISAQGYRERDTNQD